MRHSSLNEKSLYSIFRKGLPFFIRVLCQIVTSFECQFEMEFYGIRPLRLAYNISFLSLTIRTFLNGRGVDSLKARRSGPTLFFPTT